jgi:hypothetical protein
MVAGDCLTDRACWALQDTYLAISSLQNIVSCRHKPILHIIWRVWVVEVDHLLILGLHGWCGQHSGAVGERR